MARENYVVVSAGDQWRISFSGNLYGFYADAAAAIAVARDTAQKTADAGQAAAVLVETPSGNFRTEAEFEAKA
ncbi:hypothetical protein IP88_10510 [alpha proteobacterium AAP81b]|nr:hypothetical protein IP88_10510 [alpha proteobacterium AAP81b]